MFFFVIFSDHIQFSVSWVISMKFPGSSHTNAAEGEGAECVVHHDVVDRDPSTGGLVYHFLDCLRETTVFQWSRKQ